MHARDLLGVLQQALHLGLRAAVAQLEVVQHGVILLGKPLIGVLDVLHGGAHLVGVVGHIHHGHVGQLGSCVGVLANAGQQTGRKTGGLLHVVVGRKANGLVGLGGILLDRVGTVLEQRFHAAKALLQGTAHVDGIRDDLADAGRRDHFLQGADEFLTDALPGLLAKAVGLLVKHLGQGAFDALRRGHDLDIRLAQFDSVRHGVNLLSAPQGRRQILLR